MLEHRIGPLKMVIARKLATVGDQKVLQELLRKCVRVESLKEFVRMLEEVRS